MPESQTQPAGFSTPLFLAQLVLVPPIILVCGGLAWGLGMEFGILTARTASPGAASVVMNALGYLACALISFGVGRLARHWLPRFARSGGKFVWMMPLLVLICAVMFEHHATPSPGVSRFFVASPGMGQDGVGIFLFTLPALGCCFYSLGASPRRLS